jgi:glycosyltransferase involved in cell wall biosynthesis
MVAAVIPALDEEATISQVVANARVVAAVAIVVDDGSSDLTATLAESAGAIVVRHATNQGVGSAVATGLAEARRRGASIVVQVDGDGQHDPAFMDALVQRVRDGADLVIGTRFERGFDMGWVRRTVLRAFAWEISRRIGTAISDPTSGFRAFSADAADRLAPIFPKKYLSDTVETLFVAHEMGLTIEAVPVTMYQRQGGEASVGLIHGVGYTLRMAAIIARHWVKGGLRRRAR